MVRRSLKITELCFLALVFALVLPARPGFSGDDGSGRAKYVFLMIGDGMGLAQRTAAEIFLGDGSCETGHGLVMNELPVQGLCYTRSADSLVTDSAAAGTAIACGEKTAGGVIAMDRAKKKNFKSATEIAHDRGMKVGIVTSVSIDHATPACFYAHVPSRANYRDIAMQLAESSVDYFGGGKAKGAESAGEDDADVVRMAEKNGFRIVSTRRELMKLAPGEGKVWAFNHTCDGEGALYYEIDRPRDHISLAEFTALAIELLQGDEGFFIMVEGGKIDWACHANDSVTVIKDVIAFDQAVAEAVEFYEKHPAETLVVVTADHETGGMSIGCSATGYAFYPERFRGQRMSCSAFGELMKKMVAEGIDIHMALAFAGKELGLKNLSDGEVSTLSDKWEKSIDAFTQECARIISNRAGVGWTTSSHTGIPVPVSAVGAGSGLFGGFYDNTAIFRKLLLAMGEKAD